MLLLLPFTGGALKGHFGKVYLECPPLSVAVKVLCLQHVREVECVAMQECEVSISIHSVAMGAGGTSLHKFHYWLAVPPQVFLWALKEGYTTFSSNWLPPFNDVTDTCMQQIQCCGAYGHQCEM